MNDMCLELSRLPSLCRTWGIPTEADGDLFGLTEDELLENTMYREMADVELVLRFFAFRQDEQHLRGALRDYFDEYQRQANRFPKPVIQQLGDIFSATIDLAYRTLGDKAFWLWRKRGSHWNWLSRPTTVAYDTIMAVLSERLHQVDKIERAAPAIRNAIPSFYEEHYASFAGRYTNPSNIIERRQLFSGFLDSKI
jgi:hypothetical protein